MKLVYKVKFLISGPDSCWVYTDLVIALVRAAPIVFSLWCIQCYDFQDMSDMPPIVSEEQLPWVQLTPYHPQNSVNLSRHLLHAPYTSWLEVMVLVIHIYISSNGDKCPPCLIPFEWRKVIDNELPHRTINSCSPYQNINNFTKCTGTFLSNSFCPMMYSIKCLSCIKKAYAYRSVLIMVKIHCVLECEYGHFCLVCACLKPH